MFQNLSHLNDILSGPTTGRQMPKATGSVEGGTGRWEEFPALGFLVPQPCLKERFACMPFFCLSLLTNPAVLETLLLTPPF